MDFGLDPHTVPPELKKEGSDWFAIFNPSPGVGKDGAGPGGRRLDVDLVHTLMHERSVLIIHLRRCSTHVLSVLAVWSAVFVFRQTESISRQDAIAQHRFTIQRQALRLGMWRGSGHARLRTYCFFLVLSVLVDEEASKTGDLYIRSVCFSPDGKYLATGAEDKQIRVRFRPYYVDPGTNTFVVTDLGYCQTKDPNHV